MTATRIPWTLFPSREAPAGLTTPNHISVFSKPFLQMKLSAAYNVQVVVGEKEPEDRLAERFRRTVLRAGVIQEAKRRCFFETPREQTKRKAREAAKRNRKRRYYTPKASKQGEKEQPKDYDFRDDNWEITDVQVPYC